MIPGAIFDPATNKYYLSPDKKKEVLQDLKHANSYIKQEVLKQINQPLNFDWVQYYYFIPRRLKEAGYHIGVFFGP